MKNLENGRFKVARRKQRDECKMLGLYFVGGLLNKFYSKWQRDQRKLPENNNNLKKSKKGKEKEKEEEKK